jgi:hypothetical protein
MVSHRKAIRGTMLALGILAVPCSAAAALSAEFIPSPPVSRQPLAVRLADSRGVHCWPPATSTSQDGNVVTLSLASADSCSSADVLPYRDYALGSFPAGEYLFVYQSCFENPPPLPSGCNTALRARFIVPPPPVPALSRPALLALAAGMLAVCASLGLSRRVRRRPQRRRAGGIPQVPLRRHSRERGNPS